MFSRKGISKASSMVLIRGLWPPAAPVELKGMETVKEVRAAVARSTGLSEAAIHIGRRRRTSKWGWRMMEDADRSEWRDLSYFCTVERSEDLEPVSGGGIELGIHRSSGTMENAVISQFGDASEVLGFLSVLYDAEGLSAATVELRRILRDGSDLNREFAIEWDVDAATRLEDHLKGSTLCQRKRLCGQICEVLQWLYGHRWRLYWPSSKLNFFLDADGELKFVPMYRGRFYPITTESGYIRRSGSVIAEIFSCDSDVASNVGYNDGGRDKFAAAVIDGDLAELIRQCTEGEIATFAALLRCDYLDLTGSVTLSDSVNTDAAPLQWSVIYSHKGLDIVDMAASKLCVDACNIFIYEEDKLIQGGALLDYKKERSLTFLILASISGFVKADQKPLGAGAFAKVFVFEETLSGHKYAMKKFQSAIIESDSLKSFLAEIRVVKKIEHPNIVKYYDVYHEKRKSIFLQMELMQESLGAVVRRSNGGLPIGEVKFFSLQILAGLEYLHSIPILHRDLKCDNVLIQDRQAKLTDFGLAKEILMSNMHEPVMQSQVGTVYTMAPEIINSDPYDSSIDIWSFGGILWEMAAGRHSYSRLKETQQIIVIAREKVLEYNPQFPEELQLLIQLCTKKDPKERPTAAALMEDEFFKISPE